MSRIIEIGCPILMFNESTITLGIFTLFSFCKVLSLNIICFMDFFDTYLARTIDAVRPVDAYVHGCPIDKSEFLLVVKDLLLGKSNLIRH